MVAPVPPVSRPAAPVPRSEAAARPGPLVSATVAILVAATCIPLGYVAWGAVSVGWTRAYELVVRPRVGELLFNTVALVVVTVPLCVVIGVAVAWLVERTDLPGRAFWRPLFVAPLAIPAFVNSYAWVGVIPSLHGLWAGVLITTLSYFPFMYLPVAATLRRLDPGRRGIGPCARDPTRPACSSASCCRSCGWRSSAAALLIGVHLLAEFGAFAMVRFDTFTVAIFQQFQVTFDGAAGSMLAGVLVLLCLVLLIAEAAARGRARYARIGAGAPRAAMPVHLGRNAFPATAGLAVLAVLALGVPVWTIVRWLWIGGADVWDARTRSPTRSARPSRLAAVAAVLTTVLAFPVAWVAVRSNGVLARAVEGANYVTSSLPGIVTALALVTVAIHFARPLYQSRAADRLRLCPAVHAPRPGQRPRRPRTGAAQPRGGVAVAGQFAEPRRSSGSPCGSPRPPRPPAASLVFVAVATELTATLLLAPTGTRTLSMLFWSLQQRAGLRGRRTVRARAGGARHSGDADPVPAVDEGGRAMTTMLDIRGLAKVLQRQHRAGPHRPHMWPRAAPPPSSDRPAAARPRCCDSSPASKHPDAGTVTISGRQVASPERSVAPHRRSVGYVAQDGALFPHLTVGQNIAYGLSGRRPQPRSPQPRDRAARNRLPRQPHTRLADLTSSPAVSSSALRSPAHWPASRC